MTLLRRLVPYLGYIGGFIAWSWSALKVFDKGTCRSSNFPQIHDTTFKSRLWSSSYCHLAPPNRPHSRNLGSERLSDLGSCASDPRLGTEVVTSCIYMSCTSIIVSLLFVGRSLVTRLSDALPTVTVNNLQPIHCYLLLCYSV